MSRKLVARASAGCMAIVLSVGVAAPARASGTVSIVSVEDNGDQFAHGGGDATISSDGNVVAFSTAANESGTVMEVYVRKISIGETIPVSVTPTGAQGDDTADTPRISADGTHVVFLSWSDDLVTGDTNGTQDVFVRDLDTGETERANTDSSGGQANAWSTWPSISADGRYVAFESSATNLIPSDTNEATDVFVKDLQTGEIVRASVNSAGDQPPCWWFHPECSGFRPQISANGRYVVFVSSGQFTSDDENFTYDVFRHDLQSGTTIRVSQSYNPEEMGGSFDPVISADGSVVAFLSAATDLVADDDNDMWDVFVYQVGGETVRASVPEGGGIPDYYPEQPTISPDGNLVGFTSWATDLVAGDDNDSSDGFVYDRTEEDLRLVTDDDGTLGNDCVTAPVMFTDGDLVVFSSAATNLLPDDADGNEWPDVFVKSIARP